MEYYETHTGKKAAILSIDAEKTFDNVCWKFMLEHLKSMGGEGDFYKMIQAIYTIQKARVRVNGELTKSIDIHRGMRQGCPLSPLLFVSTLEVLNRCIRENKEIRGLRVRGQEFKLIAFADDLAIILEDPLKSYKALKRNWNNMWNGME